MCHREKMDVNTTATATATVIGKSPERDIDAPPRIQPSKATNGVLKRHFLPHASPKEFHAPLGGLYKECLKNHAASIGGHALDGCGEFMPAPTATAADPTSLKCAACGCHRNFHRREPEDFPVVIEYHPHHRHHPLPPPPTTHGPPPARESHSPPPISSSYPHMLLALSGGAGAGGGATQNLMNSPGSGHPSTRKRFRTKFTQEQKEKMFELAERVGWKMQKTNENVVNGVCSDIGVERGVFKVWMHNNKNTFAKRSSATNAVSDLRNGKNDDDDEENNNGGVLTHHTHLQEDDHHHHHHHHHHYNGKSNESNAPANASSSSS